MLCLIGYCLSATVKQPASGVQKSAETVNFQPYDPNGAQFAQYYGVIPFYTYIYHFKIAIEH